MGLVWDFYPYGGGELLTALALADHADHDGGSVRPGVALLVRKTRQAERTVQYHLKKMRRDTWLLAIRYGRGGYGHATEYRINPEWIRDPANFAPYAGIGVPISGINANTAMGAKNAPIKSDGGERIRVQPEVMKGADDGDIGCKVVAPQPSGTVIEPTTTIKPRAELVVAVEYEFMELEFPAVLSKERRPSAVTLLRGCPKECRQLVLNEVAGIASRGALRSPVGLLRTLVEHARAGTFVANYAIDYAEKKRRDLEQRKRAEEESARRGSQGFSSSREVAEQYIKKLRATLASGQVE